MDSIVNALVTQFNENLGNRITPALANGILMEVGKVLKAVGDVAALPEPAKEPLQTPSE